MCFRVVGILLALSANVWAVTPGEAYLAFKEGQYKKAAVLFQQLESKSSGRLAREEAQYGVAISLQKARLPIAALLRFESIIQQGGRHAYFAQSIEGLLKATDDVGGRLLVAQLLDKTYDRNVSALASVQPEALESIHYLIANRAFRSGNTDDAVRFAKVISSGHVDYAKAQYILGLVALNLISKKGSKKEDHRLAIQHFENAINATASNKKAKGYESLKNMALLALARTYYELGYSLDAKNPQRTKTIKRAIELYEKVPRFSSSWPDALFEKAWAYTVIADYGGALGSLHSLDHPYFIESFYPEAGLLRAIVYWYSCQWDRVNATLQEHKSGLLATAKDLKALVASRKTGEYWLTALERMPAKIVNRIRSLPKYGTLQGLFDSVQRERLEFNRDPILKTSALHPKMNQYFEQASRDVKKIFGTWVYRTLLQTKAEIDDVLLRARLISFETKSAEANWLEQGRTVEGQIRARLPRPHVPQDKNQFWWVRENESWIDELGYYRYTIKSECRRG